MSSQHFLHIPKYLLLCQFVFPGKDQIFQITFLNSAKHISKRRLHSIIMALFKSWFMLFSEVTGFTISIFVTQLITSLSCLSRMSQTEGGHATLAHLEPRRKSVELHCAHAANCAVCTSCANAQPKIRQLHKLCMLTYQY